MNEPVRQPVYAFEGFRLDAQRRVLFGADGRPVTLTPRLFDTLLYLVERAGQLLTKEQLLEALWPNVIVEEHNLNKTVSELRRVLGEKPGEHRFIVTKAGRGYRFVANVSVEADTKAEPVTLIPAGPVRSRAAGRYWVGVALAAAALTLAVATGNFLVGTPDVAISITPLSLEKGGQHSAVWSPDGKSVAYAVRERVGEPFRIVVRDLDSPSARQITDDTVNPVLQQWTTSGRIFYSDQSKLWSVSPVGATPEIAKLPPDPPNTRDGSMSRDGKAVALVSRGEDGVFRLWTRVLPDGELEPYDARPFVSEQLLYAYSEFSPDGRQLLVIWNRTGSEEIWLAPFPKEAGRPPRRVLEELPPVVGNGFSWLPDNAHVVVATAHGTNAPQLHLADTRTGAFRALTNDGRDKARPAVSPDGERLVYFEVDNDFDIVTLRLDTAELGPLIATQNLEEQASWAAGVPALAYLTTRSGPYELWLHREGQGDRPLVTERDFSEPHWFFAPSPSPDGKRVIYQAVAKNTGASYLWMLSVDGGSPERLTNAASERAGSWSPDGTSYVFWREDLDGTNTLQKVKTTGGAMPESLLTGAEQTPILPIWSPDGEWILVANRGLQLVSSDGKTTRDLRIENAPCGFARAEPLIYCLRAPQADGHPFVALDFEGRIVRVVGTVAPEHAPATSAGRFAPSLTLSLAPDGSTFTYSTVRRSPELWLMEGLSGIALP